MPREIVIATDSAASFTPGEADKLQIAVLPLHVLWPDGTQTAEYDMEPREFFGKMAKEGIPTTSGANVGEFLEFYRSLIENGAHEILSIHLLGKKSVVLNSATVAANEIMQELPEVRIKTIDSKTLSIAQLYVVKHAKNLIAAGASLDQAETQLEEVTQNTAMEAAFPGLDNLKKSGRLKGMASLAASMLGILPVISVEDGDLIITEKVHGNPARTRNKMIDRITKKIDQRGIPERIGVIFTYDRDVGDEVRTKLIEKLGPEIEIDDPREAGSVLGVHTGPGAAGVGLKW